VFVSLNIFVISLVMCPKYVNVIHLFCSWVFVLVSFFIFRNANKEKTKSYAPYKISMQGKKHNPSLTYKQKHTRSHKNVFTFQNRKNQSNTSVDETHLHTTITYRKNTRKTLCKFNLNDLIF
jgi:hypothetical protein